MINSFFATKLDHHQAFDSQGSRLVVTRLIVQPLTVTQVKTKDVDGYFALQCAVGKKSKKSLKQPQQKKLKQAKLNQPPRYFREITLEQLPELKLGDQIKVTDVFKPGDRLKATAISKGKGFTGVIKRWGFAGGPKTHGQSDRQRAPGSIGMRTTPGRVWKGKKMAGRSGSATITVKGLKIVDIDTDKQILTITGTVPGHRHSLVKLTKI